MAIKNNIPSPPGVSVVICCYNSATRLPDTIGHLLAQDIPAGLAWEIIVINNASTDNTAHVAHSLWPEDAPAQLRVVDEPERGLIHARKRGLREARYELVSFIDDDNWIASDWVRLAFEIMATNPAIGACGGQNEAVFEVEPPFWFDRFKRSYAVGTQNDTPGDLTWNEVRYNRYLWGAGLIVRKAAWQHLESEGFTFILSGRTGNSLKSGEDYELCDALRLTGWKLWYAPELKLEHYLPRERLTWNYLKRLHYGFGAANTGLDPYRSLADGPGKPPRHLFGKYWIFEILRCVYRLTIRHPIGFLCGKSFRFTGNHIVLASCFQIGRLVELVKLRGKYDRNFVAVRSARPGQAGHYGRIEWPIMKENYKKTRNDEKNIVIGIPTFRRPQCLWRLLDSIAAQQPPFTPHVLVADNEGEGGAGLRVVEEVRDQGFPFPLVSIAVPERGISRVRNALLKIAFDDMGADALAMVDDDERVEPGWLAALVAMQEQGGYDAVGGTVIPEFEVPTPSWAEGLHTYRIRTQPAGDVPGIYGAGSVLLNRTIHTDFQGVWFDPAFGLSGGEDTEFFTNLQHRGASFGFAPLAITHEFIHASRLTRKWALQREYQVAASEARRFKRYHPTVRGWANHFFKIPAALVVSSLLMITLFWSPRRQMRMALLMARQIGKLNGLFGSPPKIYLKTHGR